MQDCKEPILDTTDRRRPASYGLAGCRMESLPSRSQIRGIDASRARGLGFRLSVKTAQQEGLM